LHRETGVAKYIPLIKKEVKILLTGGVSSEVKINVVWKSEGGGGNVAKLVTEL
jgi:hypothetical protein